MNVTLATINRIPLSSALNERGLRREKLMNKKRCLTIMLFVTTAIGNALKHL